MTGRKPCFGAARIRLASAAASASMPSIAASPRAVSAGSRTFATSTATSTTARGFTIARPSRARIRPRAGVSVEVPSRVSAVRRGWIARGLQRTTQRSPRWVSRSVVRYANEPIPGTRQATATGAVARPSCSSTSPFSTAWTRAPSRPRREAVSAAAAALGWSVSFAAAPSEPRDHAPR